MKSKRSLTSMISNKAYLNAEFTKNLAKTISDPIRFYEGPTNANEDSADYLKFGAIKAVRLG